MKIKLSEYIADFFVQKGVEHIFTVTGGGAMHLNDAFGHKQGLTCIYNHHEQASAMAAEAYTRLTGKVAGVCVTSGPGGTNALTGVLGGWLDSIPMFIISGQVKRETTVWSTNLPLRQLGDQEFNIVSCVETMTKYAVIVTEPNKIQYYLEKAWFFCNSGRGGPVWIDIPLDIQGTIIDTDELESFQAEEIKQTENPIYLIEQTEQILEKIRQAKRPVIYAGTGIRLAGARDEFLKVIEKLNIPVVTAWNAHDLLPDYHQLNCGRPGTVGTRGGNFVVQNSDLLIILACRMNLRLISYNYKEYAKHAYKIAIDIDKAELEKPTLKIDMPICANVKDVLKAIEQSNYISENKTHKKWLVWCRQINKKYPVVCSNYFQIDKPLNPYVFIQKLFEQCEENEIIVCGNGSACVMTFQAAILKENQRLFTNSGCASMGYGFPASIGCAVAKREQRILCIDGDGSFQMNLQELQTVVYNQLNIKIIILNNNGYHSIRQTQKNLFHSSLVGVSKENGISFPELEKLAFAYQIPYIKIETINSIEEKIHNLLTTQGAVLCEVIVNPEQNFEPKLSSKVLPDGTIVSPSIDDMFPFLPKEEYEENQVWKMW